MSSQHTDVVADRGTWRRPPYWFAQALLLSSCAVERSPEPHLFVYQQEEIAAALANRGTDTVVARLDKVERNGTGTALRVFLDYAGGRAVLLLRDGRVTQIEAPGPFFRLNDQGSVVAWYDDIKRGVHFANMQVVRPALHGTFSMDPSGRFFLVGTEPGVVEVRSVEAADVRLGSARDGAERIFEKGNRLYVFTRHYKTGQREGEHQQDGVVCQVLVPEDRVVRLEREIFVPRTTARASPYSVVDLDPWSDSVLLVDVWDPPLGFLTSWYMFDLGTQKLRRLGRAGGHAFFLAEDILRHGD
jgi:hypothetical protein